MSGSTPVTPDGDRTIAVRPLPPKPSLAFERKQAKALLRQLRRGDPDALSRAHIWHPARFRSAASDGVAPVTLGLSDAQHIIAREYGFASWPRLVRYFGELERQADMLGSPQRYDRDFYDGRVQNLLGEHRDGRVWAARTLAAYVPRLYGQSIPDVLASPVTIDDAQLAVARQNRCTSWDHLLERTAAKRLLNEQDPWRRQTTPLMRAVRAITAEDLPALGAIVAEHLELLEPSSDQERQGNSLIANAVINERQHRTTGARAVTDWLASQGIDLAGPLNRMLLGSFFITATEVQYLLDRGADPNWMPANGVSVLEHAIVRYWNGEAVDLIARRVTPHSTLRAVDCGGARRRRRRAATPRPQRQANPGRSSRPTALRADEPEHHADAPRP